MFYSQQKANQAKANQPAKPCTSLKGKTNYYPNQTSHLFSTKLNDSGDVCNIEWFNLKEALPAWEAVMIAMQQQNHKRKCP